jgi:PLP dependent protein
MTLELELVRANVAAARAAIDEAARRAGRPDGTVELLAATKYVAPEDMPLLAEAGIELVGENRTDALAAKQALHADLFTWDFIGALQSRKARDVVGRVRLVHAVESLSAAEQLDRRAEGEVACLIEVDVAGEAQKAGVALAELDAFLEACVPLERLQVEGLMTMPPLAADPETSRPHFAALRELAASLDERWAGRFRFGRLSMGTSQDFAVAVEEGATIVRLGSVLYGRSSR